MAEIVDPDVDPVRSESARELAATVAVVAAGGMVGALGRYGLVRAWPAAPGTVPWSTFVINVVGCLLIGALMVWVTEASEERHYLVRPFLGVGVLGGFTTFSAYAEQSRELLAAHRPLPALGYLAGTLLAALVAVWLGAALARRVVR